MRRSWWRIEVQEPIARAGDEGYAWGHGRSPLAGALVWVAGCLRRGYLGTDERARGGLVVWGFAVPCRDFGKAGVNDLVQKR